MLTFCLWTGIKEFAQSDTAIRFTHWIYRIPFWHQVFFWWVMFTFQKMVGHLLFLLGNGLMKGLTFTAHSIGQLLETLWKYNAGKIIIGGIAAYLTYIFIF